MTDGRKRLAVPYIWPASLQFSVPHVTAVYLDLNYWIGLAKAHTSHSDGARYLPLLEAVRSHAAEGTRTFPLSGSHYWELSSINDPRQRTDVAEVMRELSEFRTLLSRTKIMHLEIEAALDDFLGLPPRFSGQELAIDRGHGHALGMAGRVRISSTGDTPDEVVRSDWPGGSAAYDHLLAAAQAECEWQMLRGPLDEDLDDLRQNYGYKPEVARNVQVGRANQEVEQVARLDEYPIWRRGRIRDVVGARYMAIELLDTVNQGLDIRGSSLDDLFQDDRERARRFVDCMPSGDVYVSLQVEAHRDSETSWAVNDIADIDALANAVPLCEVVATDRHRAHDLRVSGCAERLGTTVCSRPEELLKTLS